MSCEAASECTLYAPRKDNHNKSDSTAYFNFTKSTSCLAGYCRVGLLCRSSRPQCEISSSNSHHFSSLTLAKDATSPWCPSEALYYVRMASQYPNTTPRMGEGAPSFLTLPAECRLKIYSFLYPKIEIFCKYDRWDDKEVDIFHRRRERDSCLPKYCTALLLTSRQIDYEAKPIVDAALVILSGRENSVFPGTRLPNAWNVCSRVSELMIPGSVLAGMNIHENQIQVDYNHWQPFKFNFFRADQCPNLHTVWLRMLDGQDPLRSEDKDYLVYPVAMPQAIRHGIEGPTAGAAHQSAFNLQEIIKSFWSRSYQWRWEKGVEIDVMEGLILERGMTFKASYRFGIRGFENHGGLSENYEAFEEWFGVVRQASHFCTV